MGEYAECSRYGCEECPRAAYCEEREDDHGGGDAVTRLRQQVLADEARIRELERTMDALQRAIAAAVRAFERNDD